MKILLARNGVDPDSEGNDGRTPLLWAAGKGHEAVVKLLLAEDLVDPDSKGRYGQAPLLLAIANGHEATVKLFLAKDAVDPDSKDMFGRSALSLASRRGNSNVVKLLLENYEENGVAIRDEDVNIAIPPAADHPSCAICHICISSIRISTFTTTAESATTEISVFVRTALRLELFVWVIHRSHKLVKCKIKDGTVMEVPD